MLLGGMLLLLTPQVKIWHPEVKEKGTLSLWQVRGIQILAIEGVMMGIGWGMFDIAIPALGTLEGMQGRVGTIFAIMAAFNVLGGLVAGTISRAVSPLRAFRINYLVWAVFSIPLAFTHFDWSLAITVIFLAFLGGAQQVFYWEIVEAVRPKGTAVQAMAWLWTIEGAAAAMGIAAGGFIFRASCSALLPDDHNSCTIHRFHESLLLERKHWQTLIEFRRQKKTFALLRTLRIPRDEIFCNEVRYKQMAYISESYVLRRLKIVLNGLLAISKRKVLVGEKEWLKVLERDRWFALMDDSRAIGLMAISDRDSDRGTNCWLFSCWIDPSYRRQGLLHLLMDRFDDECRTNGWKVQRSWRLAE